MASTDFMVALMTGVVVGWLASNLIKTNSEMANVIVGAWGRVSASTLRMHLSSVRKNVARGH